MHKLRGLFGFVFILTVLVFSQSCDDPTSLGEGIVDVDATPITIETFPVQMSQQEASPITTYIPGGNLLNHAQCGRIEDDIFGKSSSSFSMQYIPRSTQLSHNPLRLIDSVKMFLYLDTASGYGVPREVTLDVVRLNQKIDGSQTFLSDETFDLGDIVVQKTFIPDYGVSDIPLGETGALVQINLPAAIGTEVFSMDSVLLNSDSAFTENFFGFHIEARNVTNYFVGFRPYFSSSTTVLSGVRIYYRNNQLDTASAQFDLVSIENSQLTPIIQQYDFDYSGSKVELAIATGNDSLIYIQGNGGVLADLTIPDLTSLTGTLVNKAELFVPIRSEGVDYVNFPQMKTLFMTRENLAGNPEFIPEFSEFAIYQFSPIGRLDTVNGAAGYAYNIPIQTQQLIDATIFHDIIRIQNVSVSTLDQRRNVFGPTNLSEATARSVIFGKQADPSKAISLVISYTN